ncbi:hypothetical protein [Saccharomonospora piscinae]|nr:hypothetical protein [Saccharomonospora piscinae]
MRTKTTTRSDACRGPWTARVLTGLLGAAVVSLLAREWPNLVRYARTKRM